MRGSRGAENPDTPTLENHKAKEFLSNSGPDALENQATKPSFNIGPLSACQRNTI